MIHASLDGIVKVCNPKRTSAHLVADHTEFLRGDSASDECEPLFKQYKSCLTVKSPNEAV